MILAGIGDVTAEGMHAFFVQEPGIISTHERMASPVMMLAELKLCYAHRKASKSAVDGLSALPFPQQVS